MDKLTAIVAEKARKAGFALVGFAPISRFDNAPPEYNPRVVFPQTKTVIAVALLQERGALKAVEEGCYWQAYNVDNYYLLNDVLSPIMLREIVMLLEEHGYTSVPVHNPFFPHCGRQTRGDMPWGPDGMVSLRMIGVAAGLGELGHSKILLTPQFGPRQRCFAVFTDAELEPTPLFKGKLCDGCLSCVKECEAGAIGRKRDIKLRIGDTEYSHASLDCSACVRVHQGRDPKFSPFCTGEEKEGELHKFGKSLHERFGHLSVCVGRGCIRACLDHLEKTGRIEKKFKLPFIDGKRWKLEGKPGRKG